MNHHPSPFVFMSTMRILLIGLLFLTTPLHSQFRTYLELEAGPARDLNRVKDAGDFLSGSSPASSISGIALWQEVFHNTFVGTGAYYHTYYSGLDIVDRRPSDASWKSFGSILVPARLAYRVQKSDYPVGFTLRAGYQFGMIYGATDPYTISSSIANPDGTVLNYAYREESPVTNTIHLLEVGVTFDYLFQNNWKLSFGVLHYSGLSDVFTGEINYGTSAGESFNSEYIMDGGRIQSTFSLHAPLSNIWHNRDLRIRSRIEGGSWWGEETRKRRSVYFGGDVGALWKQFRTSNPAIGPRPLSGRGIFRFSNLRTGGYAGYMFNENLGVELGAWYQRSTLFFAMMYDHEPDLVTRVRSPFFLEVPLLTKYYYDLFEDRIHLVPSLGIAMLTHFSGSDYLSGNDAFDFNGTTISAGFTGSRVKRFGFALKAGAGAEYRIPVEFPLVATVYLFYNHGLTPVDQTAVSTSLSEQPEISAIEYTGSGWSLSAGVKVPILLGKENRRCGAQMPSR